MPNTVTTAYNGRVQINFSGSGKKHFYRVSVPDAGIYNLYQPGVTTIIGMKDKSKPLMIWAINCMVARIEQLIDAFPVLHKLNKTALKSIIKDAKDSYADSQDESADIGSLVHRVLEQILLARNGKAPMPALPLVPDPIMAPGYTQDMIDQSNNAINAGIRFFDEHDIKVIETETPRWSPKYGYIGTGDLTALYDGELAVLDYKTSKRLYETVFLQLAANQAAYEEEHPEQKIQKRIGVNVCKNGTLDIKVRDNLTFTEDFNAFRALLYVWRWDKNNVADYKSGKIHPAPEIVGPLNQLNPTN
jgi:hypothetical protein